MSETSINIDDNIIEDTKKIINPFPGLRPFTVDESHLFFGREGQSNEVLNKLSENKFVAVIGSSGSGKSSLMYCGLLPVLHGGFITEVGSKWKVITSRPGSSPIDNLGNALITSNKLNGLEANNEDYDKAIISSILRSSSVGLVEAIKILNKQSDENFLVLIDQFEELFRFKRLRNDINAFNESIAFVKLLLEAIRQKELPIYIVLTMRSDFIGDCAMYQDLTKMINESHYLIPQMTRDDLHEAIIGPVAVGGGQITPHLVQQLLNDVGDNPDQLPILQHALMRTWDYWLKHKKTNEPLDINHYDDIGRMEKALSEHANEAHDELSQEGKQICENLFKTLTEKGSDNRGIRHPTSVEDITTIAQTSIEEVTEVIEKFRISGRSFLAPSSEIKLTEKTIIDVSHESIMRIWDKLKIWVNEEAAAVQMYIRLSEAAARYQEGKTGLWRPPDLQLAINWKEKQNPTLDWAKRYAPAFERTMVYLDTSEKAYIAEEENKIKLQKRTIRRTKIFAMILGIASIISLGFMLYSVIMKQEADKNRVIAEQQTTIAENKTNEAEEQRVIAEKQKEEAEKQKEEAEKQKEIANTQEKRAVISAQKALRQEKIANRKSIEANEQRKLAVESEKEALAQKSAAEKAKDEAYNLRMLSIAQSMAVKSLQIKTDDEQKALIAYHAYKFNKQYNGIAHHPDIYNGLYSALKSLDKNVDNNLSGHSNSVRKLVYNTKNNILYSTSSDGKIFSWNINNEDNNYELLYKNNFINRTLTVSNDGKWLANSTGSKIQLFSITNNDTIPKIFNSHKKTIWAMDFCPDNKNLISCGADNLVQFTNIETEKNKIISSDFKVKTITMSTDGNLIAGTTDEGSLIFWDKSNNYITSIMKTVATKDGKVLLAELNSEDPKITNLQEVSYAFLIVSFNFDKTLMATGDKQGNIMIWDLAKNELIITLTGHNARINDIKFSSDNKFVASASSDGTIRLWETSNFNNQPIVLQDIDAWVVSLAFSPDGSKLYSGYVNGQIQCWPTKSEYMTEQICSKISRNLSKKEWETYVAKDIPFEKTCNNISE